MSRSILILLLVFVNTLSYAQPFTQTIKGRVIDEATHEPIPFANVVILNTSPLIGASTDLEGYYIINEVPLGRYDVQVSFIGYQSVIAPELVVTSAKEVMLDFQLQEDQNVLDAVVVKPTILKQKPLNQMATVSARMLSVEEASRYAGGFDDPARLASAFPGVATSTVGSNALIIRGNAPKYLSWNIEGVEIPNPNHFADLGVFGGGGLTALSSNLMSNSDFFTGAFPAVYNNAISGVFDLRMRNGNSSIHEHSFELGLIGIDLASEGPISKKNGSSYLFNYRYSTLGLIAQFLPEGVGINYQDLSFKIKLPTKNAGRFSIWGIGLHDTNTSTYQEDISRRAYRSDYENSAATLSMGAAGVNHRLMLSNSSYLNTSLSFSTNQVNFRIDRLAEDETLYPQSDIQNINSVINLQSFVNRRFSATHKNQTGIKIRVMNYDLHIQEAAAPGTVPIELVAESGWSSLTSLYTNSSFTSNNLTLNLGVSGQYFAVNEQLLLEPRLGLAYDLDESHAVSIGYGLHSRIEPLQTYFTYTSPNTQANKDLGLVRAHHLVLAFDWDCTEKLHLKMEPYIQYLFDVPMVAETNHSILNNNADWFVTDSYVNEGLGMNYGIDLTLEQYIDNGFYYLMSGSVFQSKFKNATQWFNTRYNKNFLANLLVGKEFRVGKNEQNLLSLNARLSYQGGERFSRIDITSSNALQEVIFNDASPFSEQVDPFLLTSFTINYEWYKRNISHKISLKVINATGYEEYVGHDYNLLSNRAEAVQEAIVIPNVSYKIMF